MSDLLTISGRPCCTVQELIDHLKTMPPDAPVMYRECSDHSALQLDQVIYMPSSAKHFVRRQDGIQQTYPAMQWGDEVPQYVGVVMFPGN